MVRHDGLFYLALAALAITASSTVRAFVPVLGVPNPRRSASPPTLFATEDGKKAGVGGFFEGVSNFFQELDDFLDDASARRLGNGAAFYGKRKSKFYGEKDKNRKSNPSVADRSEDYYAPNTGGYFQWMPDENGEMRPVTRMKKRIVERNSKVFERDNE